MSKPSLKEFLSNRTYIFNNFQISTESVIFETRNYLNQFEAFISDIDVVSAVSIGGFPYSDRMYTYRIPKSQFSDWDDPEEFDAKGYVDAIQKKVLNELTDRVAVKQAGLEQTMGKCNHSWTVDMSTTLLSEPPRYKRTCNSCKIIEYVTKDKINIRVDSIIGGSSILSNTPKISKIGLLSYLFSQKDIDFNFNTEYQQLNIIGGDKELADYLNSNNIQFTYCDAGKEKEYDCYCTITIELSQWD